MKECTKCKTSKPIGEFSDSKTTKDGKQTQCKSCLSAYARFKRQERADIEIVTENVKLAKGKQRLQDLNRVERKAFREDARYQNAITEYSKKIIEVLSEYKFNDIPPPLKENTKASGLLHLTDLHFNELVELEQNQYDFGIAGQRLRMYVQRATAHFKALGITNVCLALTGDLMNSDRRLDEILAMATNRARATVLAQDILQQLIHEIALDFNVTVGWVNGNEGRIGQELGYQNEIASDNFDEVIVRGLQLLFRNVERVTFINSPDPLETVINIAGHNILLVHGHCLGKNYDNSIPKLKAKYASRGIIIRYVVFGHLHEALIADLYARGSSPVGDNTYSDKGLNLAGRASQNCHIIYDNGNIDSIKIDLQVYDGVVGYSTNEEFWAFNIKSAKKCHKDETIFKVVV